MYFQCEPDAVPDAYSEQRLWEELQSRVPGTTLKEGPIFPRDVLNFRSLVARKHLKDREALIGDAAHTVPLTGAKGMNLAIADVLVLERALRALLLHGDDRLIEQFPETALRRIWKVQHFSWSMTSMLHAGSDASDFHRQRQLGELRSVVDSRAGSTYLAEARTGCPWKSELSGVGCFRPAPRRLVLRHP